MTSEKNASKVDIFTQTVMQKVLENICTEMTVVLRRSAYSPNIKERMDFSCALFNQQGALIASREGIPVHLGSMTEAVQAGIKRFKHDSFSRGDVLIHNAPYDGGTHLPDINLYAPIFISQNETPDFWSACRAHHADVGGKTPGSMPSNSETLFEEGIQIPPIKLWKKFELQKGVWEILLANVRTPDERQGDFQAQRAALLTGEKRIIALCQKYGLRIVNEAINHLNIRSQKASNEYLEQIPLGTSVTAQDFLDSDGNIDEPVLIQVTLTRKKHKLVIDFTGSANQRFANCNTTSAITRSCVYYVFRYLLAEWGWFPTNAGLWEPLEIVLPPNSVINADHPHATSSGNVETSQRIVDVCFKALAKIPEISDKIPAASQGTMNNISIGGVGWTYYETLGGGSGATKTQHGASGIHTHMTNTLNTPIEALELIYPLRIHQYQLRRNSGGKGKKNGGDGLIREYEMLTEQGTVSLQTERRKYVPWGINGGKNGMKGENWINLKNEPWKKLPARCTLKITKNDRIKVITPSGGGMDSQN
ncbi:MAG: hydantoinase B/oxoprolinase family protein [Candidatus Hodarchaeales archaeon]|jgi:N-methylhydantoinase B